MIPHAVSLAFVALACALLASIAPHVLHAALGAVAAGVGQ